jgi:hypothetical protein
MKIKPRHKRRFFWSIIILIGLIIIGFICIPPFINLNKMKPVLESKLYEQTGIRMKINGDVNFSMLGYTTIIAHNIDVPNGKIGNISFSVPFNQIFNLQQAKLNQDISINNANLKITDLFPYTTKHKINIYDAHIDFMNHDYHIIRGALDENKFNGHVRTAQHKYDIKYNNGEFIILNSNDNLHIRGTLFPDGGAAGEMSITTDNINKWFEFSHPKINEPVSLSMDFNWDGEYGFDFTNIHANGYTGSIKLLPSGFNSIHFKSDNANLDLSFIAYDKNMINKTNMNLDLYGKIKFKENIFSHVMVIAAGLNNKLEINHVICDNTELFGGTYDNDGLHDTKLQINNLGEKFSCMFSGTPNKWECKNFIYGNIKGNITTDNGIFKITASSTDKMPSNQTIRKLLTHIGDSGTIDFTFSDMSGTMVITPKQMIPKFSYAQNVTLTDVNLDMKFLPEFMNTSVGTYTSNGDKKTFIPQNQQWMLDISGENFSITGKNFKQWLPNLDLRFINNLPYAISGTYNDKNIGNLYIMIADHIISGVATKSGLTLYTQILNIDKFINQKFMDNYEEQKFLTNHPLATLFDMPINISLSADELIFNGQEYNNFVYALKPDTQTFSISDTNRGHLLGIIEKKKFDYDVSIQLNKFKTDGEFLKFNTPLNISNSTITGEIVLHTSGQTANDLIYNITGDLDLTFIGGEINGFGFDKFYASADQLNVLNAEYAISSAMESGITQIKKLKIYGKYSNGNFETTRPLTISMRHVEGVGGIFINKRIMTGTFDFVMRGTAPQPVKISLDINDNGRRSYSVNEIINNLDVGFMRAFIRTHNKY